MDKILSSLESFKDKVAQSESQEPEEKEKPRYPRYALIFWAQTNQFNVMPSTRIPKKMRLEGGEGEIKAEKKMWKVKVLKLGGEYVKNCMVTHVICRA